MIEAILQRVSRIPLRVRWRTQQPRLGQHHSHMRGAGMEFDQIKEYQAGEAIRKVNWAATARSGSAVPLVNVYYEEKDITVMLLVDLSASMNFGSTRLTKRALAAEMSASLVYSALSAHDRIGLLGFTTHIACYLPPRRDKSYQRTIPETILHGDGEGSRADFSTVVEKFEHWVKQPTLVFLLSDFLTEETQQLFQALTRLRRRHDPIALILTDPLEVGLPAGNARMITRDLETGKLLPYTFTRAHQRRMAERGRARQTQLRQALQRLGIPHVTVTPHSDYREDLSRLFLTRHRRSCA